MDWLNRNILTSRGYGEQDDLRHMDFVLMQFIAIGNELSLKLKPYDGVYEQYCESLNAMMLIDALPTSGSDHEEPVGMLALFRDALRSALRIAQHCCVSGDGDCIAMPDLIEKVVASSKRLGRETKDYPIEQNLHLFIEEFLPRYLLYDSNLAFEIGEKSALVEPYQLSMKQIKGLDNIAGLSMVFRLPVLAERFAFGHIHGWINCPATSAMMPMISLMSCLRKSAVNCMLTRLTLFSILRRSCRTGLSHCFRAIQCHCQGFETRVMKRRGLASVVTPFSSSRAPRYALSVRKRF